MSKVLVWEALGKGHLMIMLLELKKVNHGINLVGEVKNLMRTCILPLLLMSKFVKTLHPIFLRNRSVEASKGGSHHQVY